jgi:hypothetical protein
LFSKFNYETNQQTYCISIANNTFNFNHKILILFDTYLKKYLISYLPIIILQTIMKTWLLKLNKKNYICDLKNNLKIRELLILRDGCYIQKN